MPDTKLINTPEGNRVIEPLPARIVCTNALTAPAVSTVWDDMPDDVGALADTPRHVKARNVNGFEPTATLYKETCPKCRGTGLWSGGYVNPTSRACFACNGVGHKTFKTSPEVRRERAAHARDPQVLAEKERARQAANQKVLARNEQWKLDNAAEYAWLHKAAATFEFASSCLNSLTKYGHLSDGQMAAVHKCMDRDVEREATKAARAAAQLAVAPQVDVSRIVASFEHARLKGIKKPKVNLDTFKFSRAPDTGINAGSLYVTNLDDENPDTNYLGKITAGKFIRSRNCTDEQETRIVVAASDPLASAKAYGQRTGNCSICSRLLTNHASIDLGIGPICAGRMGW